MEPNLTEHAALSRIPKLLTIILLALLALLAFPDPARALGNHIGFEAAPWMQGLEGQAQISDSSTPGTTVDFADTLGLHEDTTSPIGRLWFRGNKSSFILDIADSSHSGDGVLTENLDFNGTVYPASEAVSTDFDVRTLAAKWRYSFVNQAIVEFGFDLGASVAKFDIQLDGSTTGVTTFTESVPYPTVGLSLTIKPLPGFHIRLEADGISGTVSGYGTHILDARVQIEKYFAHAMGIFGGYREYRFDVEADSFGMFETQFKGAYAGLGFKF